MDLSPEEQRLVDGLRRGETAAFREALRRYHGSMLRLARSYVRSHAAAEDIAQETWLAVLRGIDRFEGRSSLKAWLFGILANKARTRAVADGRFTLFSELAGDRGEEGPSDGDAFDAAGAWRTPPADWDSLTPERLLSAKEMLALAGRALDQLPPAQKAVLVLRDIEGLDTAEACNVLGIKETNFRVLLHRGRAGLRDRVEEMLAASARGDKSAANA